ncbi:non-structural maintenance of chromosomes element 1 homolog isoform X1 [Lepisosteus oculatus]|uniref:non-structural maintenance of chromosomes element 1 homolog isoform X1 n=1 Tax=Lepisosteus oculatus TaxID=7918 RepID=UPI0035F5213B
MAKHMTDSHRRFLQSLMCCGIIEGSKARALHRHCCEVHRVHYPHEGLDDFIRVINTHLQPMFMQIRKGMSEEDGVQYYALVNITETDVTRMASDYSDTELELFRKAMDLIVDSETGTASSTEILNLADRLQPKKMKKKETEQVLQRLVQDKWLYEKDGEYTLSTRCIMEMEPYIQNIYQDLVKVCNICRNIAIQGQMCENPECGIKMHIPCVARYFKGRTDPRCPSCNEFWPHEIPDLSCPSPQAPSPGQAMAAKENTTQDTAPSRSKRLRK